MKLKNWFIRKFDLPFVDEEKEKEEEEERQHVMRRIDYLLDMELKMRRIQNILFMKINQEKDKRYVPEILFEIQGVMDYKSIDK